MPLSVAGIVFLFIFCICTYAHIEILSYDPVAKPAAVIQVGLARFTVLTPSLVRMEYKSAPEASFLDRATLAFVNRNLAVPAFTSSQSGGVLTITTDAVQISYVVGQPFSETSLRVKSTDPQSTFSSWVFGQTDTLNLLGTIRSLDTLGVVSLNCTENAAIQVHGEELHCEWGLISRSGWSVVNDTANYVLDADYWWDGQNPLVHDLYLYVPF
jgi:hypothetical protein